MVAILVAVLKALMVLGDVDVGDDSAGGSFKPAALGGGGGSGGGDEFDFSGLDLVEVSALSLPHFAKYTLRQICRQPWVQYRCLQVRGH